MIHARSSELKKKLTVLEWQHLDKQDAIKIIPRLKSIRYLGWFTDNQLHSQEQHNQLAHKVMAKLASLHMQGRSMQMWERGIKVYCNALVNHLTSI